MVPEPFPQRPLARYAALIRMAQDADEAKLATVRRQIQSRFYFTAPVAEATAEAILRRCYPFFSH